MKKVNVFARSLVCAGALSVSAFANAGTVGFTNLTASWINIDPVSVVATGNGSDTASISWGKAALPGGEPTSYVFQTIATPFTVDLPPSPSSEFDLGTWTHNNNPVTFPSGFPTVYEELVSATLQLDASISVDGTSVGQKSFFFDFMHTETDNGAGPCANGEANYSGVNINGCADFVDIVFNNLSQNFEVGNDTYTLNILAGSNHLESIENQANSFNIQASLELDTREVSEPGALALFALGIAGLATRLRRQVA